ncbi:type II toxin-antitoxin system VapC family toxin [Georgenia sp. MJ173]|uniref:type II toxin-antitoxin system VapC family toxin n=1 Tax=Georgenia sunbinii TaxID=3117728 RepID=UPI002F26A558
MILYVDTSALVPLLVDEPTSAACGELWDAADTITATPLAYIEAAAALALAERLGRVSSHESHEGTAILDALWLVVHVIELDQGLMAEAARLAKVYGLRGYDATHCAAAVAVEDPELLASSGDGRLLAAWRSEGLAVRDTNA